jgi:protein-tyrosine phosphatase
MLSFFNRYQKVRQPGVFLHTDIHAHWLPGLDDGAKDSNESLEMISLYVQLGYRRLIATPHVYHEMYPNTSTHIQQSFETIKNLAKKHFPDLEVAYAAEYFMDEDFKKLLSEKQLLCVWDKKVLVEQGYFAEIPGILEIFFEMHLQGYQPILAHPERYTYYFNNTNRLSQFRDAGADLQLNLGSIMGKYGPQVKKQAYTLLDLNLIDYIATDAHSPADLKSLSDLKIKSLKILNKPITPP